MKIQIGTVVHDCGECDAQTWIIVYLNPNEMHLAATPDCIEFSVRSIDELQPTEPAEEVTQPRQVAGGNRPIVDVVRKVKAVVATLRSRLKSRH